MYLNKFTRTVKKHFKYKTSFFTLVLRAKVLYGTEATIKKPKYNDDMQFKRFDKLWGGRFNTMQPITIQADEPTVLNCGVDLTTLSKILEEGRF